jgi:hypothetical protein
MCGRVASITAVEEIGGRHRTRGDEVRYDDVIILLSIPSRSEAEPMRKFSDPGDI